MQIQREIKYFTEAQIYQKLLFWGFENFTNYPGSKYFDIFGPGGTKNAGAFCMTVPVNVYELMQ